jgi:hypothetical protein
MITKIENRFKEITGLTELNLSKYPIRKTDYENQQQKTSETDIKERGYVTTPIFLVDAMIALKYNELLPTHQTCDLCAGEAGQFTIRLMRMLYNKFNLDIENWLKNNHTFVELFPESCAKLVYIYGPNINLYCGDATKLSLIGTEDSGIIFYDDNNNCWKSNELVNQLIQLDVVKNSIQLLTFVFCNHNYPNKLKNLLGKLK